MPPAARAIDNYRDVLSVTDQESAPDDWATVRRDLALILVAREQRDRGRNLEEAKALLEAALTVWTEKTNPAEWAGAKKWLASIALLEDPNSSANRQRARALLLEALRGYEAAGDEQGVADVRSTLTRIGEDRPQPPTG